jgi:hypothetical protein
MLYAVVVVVIFDFVFVVVFGQAFICVCVSCVFRYRVFFRGLLLWDFTARLTPGLQASLIVFP